MRLIRTYPPSRDQWRWLLLWGGIFLAAQVVVILVINLYYVLIGG